MKKIFIILCTFLTLLISADTKSSDTSPYIKIEIIGVQEASENLNKTSTDFLNGMKEITKILQNDNLKQKDKESISNILQKLQQTLDKTNSLIDNVNLKTKQFKMPTEKFINKSIKKTDTLINTYIKNINKKLNEFKDNLTNKILIVLSIFTLTIILLFFFISKKIKNLVSEILPLQDLTKSINKLTNKIDQNVLD